MRTNIFVLPCTICSLNTAGPFCVKVLVVMQSQIMKVIYRFVWCTYTALPILKSSLLSEATYDYLIHREKQAEMYSKMCLVCCLSLRCAFHCECPRFSESISKTSELALELYSQMKAQNWATSAQQHQPCKEASRLVHSGYRGVHNTMIIVDPVCLEKVSKSHSLDNCILWPPFILALLHYWDFRFRFRLLLLV